jgi:F-type H+-transporting ATPase subunit b
MELFHEPKFWVAMGFLGFIALAMYLKLPGMLTRMLDERSLRIRQELEQARSLREEAEKTLAEYKHMQAQYLQEAEAMLKKAQADADAFRAQANIELKAAMAARMQGAMDRIAQEEKKAVQDVRNHVVDIVLAATRAMLAERPAQAQQDELVKLALADIEHKLH